MLGIRKFLHRHFSIEAMTTALERRIATDMAADPSHPRNAVGSQLLGSIRSEREKAIARRELDALVPEYQRRGQALTQAADHFNNQPEQWRASNLNLKAQLENEDRNLSAMAQRISELAEIANG
jgi:hypothetical protein